MAHSAVHVRILDDPQAVAEAAGLEFLTHASSAIHDRGVCTVALAGGSTPRQFYAWLASAINASPEYCGLVKQIQFFWGDERCVPPDHADSNFRMVQEVLFSRITVPAEHIHRIPVEVGDAATAASSYERLLREAFHLSDGAWPEFDLVCLGIGNDGHTASLFPRAASLRESHRLATETTGGDPDVPRVTLTVPVLNRAKRLMWLVAGATKAAIVRDVLEGPRRPEDLPAQQIQPGSGVALWLMDRAAARLLQNVESGG